MTAEKQLLEIYREFPCRTLPNAFWKTAAVLDQGNLVVHQDRADMLQSLAVWKADRLVALWCSNPETVNLTEEQIDRVPFALVHADCLSLFSHRKFSTRKAYFRLIHRGAPREVDLPSGFSFITVDPDRDVGEIVRLLQACYPGIAITSTVVRGWTSHVVYDPSLWVWIADGRIGKKAGLGIAELDRSVPEATLEWVQILPHYQKRGLGIALVRELLHRVHLRADFTTVSGECDNPSNPESVYRKCGFTGSDVWWLLAE